MFMIFLVIFEMDFSVQMIKIKDAIMEFDAFTDIKKVPIQNAIQTQAEKF